MIISMERTSGTKNFKWLQVKLALERDIIVGNYNAGDQIPTIEQLMVKYSIGRTSAQRVLNELAEEGLIVRKVGKGCFVKPFVRERIRDDHREEAITSLKKAVVSLSEIGLSKTEINAFVRDALREGKRS